MIEKVHEHILEELKINARADTHFILAAITLNLITLAINSSISGTEFKNVITMIIFSFLTIVISIIAEIGLIKGRQASRKLLIGLIDIYKDNDVSKYYNVTLLDHYKSRYNLFIIIILFTGIISVIVPFININ
ncbi:MAG: hypothetical protein OCD02_10315 [Spirochaetaceae bacterium]